MHFLYSITARFGTIWHVAVGGTGEYSIKPAKGCTDHVVVATKKGTKIQVFRHTALSPSGLSAISLPSAQTIFDVTPTVLFVFLCVAFLVQKSSVCLDNMESKSVITKGLCLATTSFSLTPLAVALFVMTIVKQVKKSIQQKRLKNKMSGKRK
jgi:hypothetical protein